MGDKKYAIGFWGFVVLLFAIGILGPMHERAEKEAVRQARREESEARMREFDKPIKMTPWITCNEDGTSCIVRELPAVGQ